MNNSVASANVNNVNPKDANKDTEKKVSKASSKVKQEGNVLTNALGVVFGILPGIVSKAAHGFSYLVGRLKNDTSAFQVQKASGEELRKNLL